MVYVYGPDRRPAALIDVLHRCCSLLETNGLDGVADFLGRSGHGANERLWQVAQGLTVVIPEDDEERHALDRLLSHRRRIEALLRD